MFGNPETTTGGKALKFYSSVRIDVRKADAIKDGTGIIGNRTKIKIVKNKLAPPFKSAECDIIYGKGISQAGCLLDLGVDLGLIEKSGSWFSIGGEKIAQGREKARDYLETHQDVADQIEKQIREAVLVAPEEAED